MAASKPRALWLRLRNTPILRMLRLEEALSMLEERLTREQRAKWRLMPSGAPDAFAFPAGYNKEVRSFTLNLDPPSCNIKTRPLFYYALTDGLLCGLVRLASCPQLELGQLLILLAQLLLKLVQLGVALLGGSRGLVGQRVIKRV